MSTLKAGKLQHPDAANSSIEFDSSGNITKFVGPSGGADGNVLTKSGTAPAWTSAGAVGGLVLIAAESFSAVSSVSVNGCFTSTYANYFLLGKLVQSQRAYMLMRMRASGSDNSENLYQDQYVSIGSTSVVAARRSNQSSMRVGFGDVTTCILQAYIASPQLTETTAGRSLFSGDTASEPEFLDTVIGHNKTTSYDGFTIFPESGTMTGTIRIYGYRNTP